MSTTEFPAPADTVTTGDDDRRQADAAALAETLFDGVKASMDVLTVYLGVRLGLYEALADGEARTPGQVAERAAVHPRYAREWLEQQAAAGVLAVGRDHDDPRLRSFRLPAGHRDVLLDEEHPAYLGSAPQFLTGIADVLPKLLRCYRTGDGVPYGAYGTAVRQGIAGMNRPGYSSALASDWLPALPDVHARLAAGERVDVLDLGCGSGWSAISLAQAFPNARITGVDLDEPSIADARSHAARQGVADRVAFHVGDAARSGHGGFDLVCVFEALHDMADPVGVLASVRESLREGGVLLVADEKVNERFEAPAPVMEQFAYAASVLHCLPATRAEGAVEDAGTVLRPPTVREYGRRAGYRTVEPLGVEHGMWNFYRFDA
ncbi:class I SAM-dependent methyltransferase [Streptomyces sp. HK10]|uniref:class I SAM-dependent methyltransferase n=1 Tax=Streptomyces sp. HK10 TaxID=3373255 RepID=UPI0037499EFE